jgi:hypothetical protein
LSARYSDKVQFIIIYTIEAHPQGSQPETYEERVALAVSCSDEDNIGVLLLVDEMDNPVWCTYGPAPNNAYLISSDGTIVEKQGWYQPQLMEAAIQKYLEENTA